jgi:hypothetical protein
VRRTILALVIGAGSTAVLGLASCKSFGEDATERPGVAPDARTPDATTGGERRYFYGISYGRGGPTRILFDNIVVEQL